MEPLKNVNSVVRILIVEDDEEMRSLLRDFIEEEGYEAETAHNGSEAFRKLAKGVFGLIITDVRMPGLTGLDILPGIRKLHPGIPIIVITAFGSEEVQRRSYEKGATFYLEKPIHFQELRELIHQMGLSGGVPRSSMERGEEGGKKW